MSSVFGFRLHSLQLRILAFFVVVFLVLASTLAYITISNRRNALTIYNDSLQKAHEDLTGELKNSSLLTMALAPDYSVWDDPYLYLSGKLPSYAEDNLTQSVLDTFQSDAMWMFYNNGKLAAKINQTEPTEGEIDFTAIQKDITTLFSKSPRIHFFAKTRTGIMEIFGSIVTRTDDPKQSGKSPGYLLTGKLMNSKTLSGYQNKAIASVKLLNPQQLKAYPSKLPASSGSLVATVGYKTIDGQDIGTVLALYNNKSIQSLYNSNKIELILNTVIFLFLLFSISFVLWRWVVKPLNVIYTGLETADSEKLKNLAAKNSEFGKIALLLDRFFEQQAVLKKEIQDKAVVANELDIQRTELMSINEAMIGRELRMIELKKEIIELKLRLDEKK